MSAEKTFEIFIVILMIMGLGALMLSGIAKTQTQGTAEANATNYSISTILSISEMMPVIGFIVGCVILVLVLKAAFNGIGNAAAK